MQLLLPDGETLKQLQRDIKTDPGAKFVLFAKSDGTAVARLFPFHLQHSQVVDFLFKADPTLTFVGAGFVLADVARWGSDSCMKHFGRDRPADEEKQDTLLDDLEQEVLNQL